MTTIDFAAGGYRFIPGVFQYSGGVAAAKGHEIRRVRFHKPVPLAEGFARIEQIIQAGARPLTAFCACELRSPAPFDDGGFLAFNEAYVVTLKRWGLFDGKTNPVARSNVCPEFAPPAQPSFHAFSYTVKADAAPPSFVIAGSAESKPGSGPYSERTVRHGDQSPGAIREKARYVLDVMQERLKMLGLGWSDTTAAQVYTVYDLYPFLADEIVKRGAAHAGLIWHFARPPVLDLDYEMDIRGVRHETIID